MEKLNELTPKEVGSSKLLREKLNVLIANQNKLIDRLESYKQGEPKKQEDTKVKLFELAKELGIASKVIVDLAKAEGIEVVSHMSSVTLAEAEKLKIKAKEVEQNE